MGQDPSKPIHQLSNDQDIGAVPLRVYFLFRITRWDDKRILQHDAK